MEEIYIDATNAILGRLAAYAAKQSLQGKKVVIVNAERAIITGNKQGIVAKYIEMKQKGGTAQRGPYFSRSPARILKRTIRGMVPNYRTGRGRIAFKRILCYKGIPEEFKDKKMLKSGKEKHTKYMNLEQVSKKI